MEVIGMTRQTLNAVASLRPLLTCARSAQVGESQIMGPQPSYSDPLEQLERLDEMTAITDNCPEWADQLIRKIYLLEIEAGAIANPKSGQWSTTTESDLMKLADQIDSSANREIGPGELADQIFERVVRGLSSEEYDFTPESIAAMVNVRIPTGSRLQYCSPSEVLSTLDRPS